MLYVYLIPRLEKADSWSILGTPLWAGRFIRLIWGEGSHLVRGWKVGVVFTRVFVQLKWAFHLTLVFSVLFLPFSLNVSAIEVLVLSQYNFAMRIMWFF